jgi:hypothetical protein
MTVLSIEATARSEIMPWAQRKKLLYSGKKEWLSRAIRFKI